MLRVNCLVGSFVDLLDRMVVVFLVGRLVVGQ